MTTIRHDALAQHVSQVIGYPPLCTPVYIPSFYTRWNEKVEEPFYEEVFEQQVLGAHAGRSTTSIDSNLKTLASSAAPVPTRR